VIKSFALENYRGFAQRQKLELGRMSCLVGRNSSGKSSVIQALMVLKQSIEQRAVGSRLPQLNLTGSLIDAGTYEDVVNSHDTDRSITFSFDVEVDLGRSRRERKPRRPLVRLDVPRPQPLRLWSPSYEVDHYIESQRRERKRNVNIALTFAPEPPFGPTLSNMHVTVEELGEVNFTRTTGEQRVQHWRAYPVDLPNRSTELWFPAWSFLPVVMLRRGRLKQAKETDRRHATEFVASSQLALTEVTTLLAEMRAVGPFRTPPARRYAFTGLAAPDTGLTGERAVDLLITEKLLGSGEPLRRGVARWMQHLGLARNLKVQGLARKSNIFALSLSGAGTARVANFADVGFGISQVLPVLAQGYLVPRGGLYVVQQPELHLHPDAQAGLADYFLFLASRGVRCLVETHSEYLLVRLRRRLAEGLRLLRKDRSEEPDTDSAQMGADDVRVAYVSESDGRSTIVQLRLNKGFQFENLPEGFMSEAVDDRVALMKALKDR
jgi:predicted ATPase